MSELFKQALLEAKKLREVAEIDAKNRIIDQVGPYVKDMINKELNSKYNLSENFFTEQEEDTLEAPGEAAPEAELGSDQETPTAQEPTTTDVATQSNLAGDEELGNQEEESPIDVSGDEMAGATLPDEEGKITVEIDDLFTSGEEETEGLGEPNGTEEAPEVSATELASSEEDIEQPAEEEGLEAEEELPSPQLSAESLVYEKFKSSLNEVSSKIDKAFFRKEISDITKESLKNRLFQLLETLDTLNENGLINENQMKKNENTLEFLFLKLKEAGLNNSYNMTSKESEPMASLKEFAAQLFEEEEKVDLEKDTQSSGDTGVHTDDEYSEHAADVSGVDPNLGDTEDIEVAQEKSLAEEMNAGFSGTVDADPISDKEPGEEHWDEAEPSIDEEDQDKVVSENSADANTDANEDVAEGAAGFGDTDEEPEVEFEVDDGELREAVRSIRKENIRRMYKKLMEASDGSDDDSWEDASPEAGLDPTVDSLKGENEKGAKESIVENIEEMDYMSEQEDEMDVDVVDVVDDVDDDEEMDVAVVGADEDVDLVLNVDLPDEAEEALANASEGDIDVDVDLGAVDMDYDEEEYSDDMDYEDDMVGAETEDVVLADEDDGMEEMSMKYENVAKSLRRKLRTESKRNRSLRSKIRESVRKQKKLEKQLQETNVFAAKTIYLNKFLMREGLSRKAMRQIVEHLDRTKTIAEAKAVYNKISARLDEHVKASRKLAGSASKVTKPGSAKLNESVSRTPSQNEIQVQRWQKLANIKPNK